MQAVVDYESSEELLSSEQSSKGNCTSDTAIGNMPIKNKHMFTDRKILSKFNRLTKRLEETSSNLQTVDRMIGRTRRPSYGNRSETCLSQGCHYRRASSMPPPIRGSDHYSGGDNLQNHRSQSVENLELPGNMMETVGKLAKMSQSLQDLTSSISLKQNEEPPQVPRLLPKNDQDNSTSTKIGSEISLGLGDSMTTKPTESLLTQSSRQSSILLVDDLRSEISDLKLQLQKMHGPYKDQTCGLHKQLQTKDQQLNELSMQLQELTNKLEISEDQREQLFLRFENALHTSFDVTNEAERLSLEVKRMEDKAAELKAEKDKLRKRAKSIVQELKDKCRLYVLDIQRLRDREWQMDEKSSKYVQEIAIVKTQLTCLSDKVQEMNAELVEEKCQKEQIQKSLVEKDLELSQMRASCQETQMNVQNLKELNEKLNCENSCGKEKLGNLTSQNSQLEIQLASKDKESEILKQLLEEIKYEMKCKVNSNNEFQAQLLAETSIRQAVEVTAHELSEKIKKLEQRMLDMQEKYLEAVGDHGKVTERLRQELANQKAVEDQNLQEAIKNSHKQYEQRLTALKLDLAENQAIVQTLTDSLKKEQDMKANLKNEIFRLKDDYNVLDNKYKQLCKFYLMKKQKLQEKDQSIKMLQQNIYEVQNVSKCLEEQFKDILHLINDDIDAAATSLIDDDNIYPQVSVQNVTENELSSSVVQSREWLTGIKKKLQWMKKSVESVSLRSNERFGTSHTASMDSIHTFVPLRIAWRSQSDTNHHVATTSEENLPPKLERPSSAPAVKQLTKIHESCEPSVEVEEPKEVEFQSPAYPFNSTQVKEAEDLGEIEPVSISKRYQKFEQMFEKVHVEFRTSKIHAEPDLHDDSSKACPVSTGHLSVTSSLSSISEFSCDFGASNDAVTSVNQETPTNDM